MRRPARAAARRLLGLLGVLAATACGEPPSLVLVTLDTLRTDHVGVYGGADLTPRLDAFAARGLVHEVAFTTMPMTVPAHASIFTGLPPREHGVRTNGIPLPERLRSRELARRLGERGYHTAAFVSAHLMGAGITGFGGFDVYDAPGRGMRPGAVTVRDAADWLAATPARPLFLWVHLYDPHAPYGDWTEKARDWRVDPARYGFVEPRRFATQAARQAMRDRYADGVRAVDAALGRLLEVVDRELEAPLVVVTSDHGEALQEHLKTRGYAHDHGEFLDPEQVRVVMVLAGPGVRPGRAQGAAGLRDLYATLLRAAGAAPVGDAVSGLRDLRRPVDEDRVLQVERRRLTGRDLRELAPRQMAAVRSHAVAATDGTRTLILGEDGTVHGDAAPALEAAARESLAALEAADAEPLELDPAAREALESLGYLVD